MTLRNRQGGMSFIGLLTVIILIISMALLAMKMVPVYLRNHTIRNVIEGMKDVPGVSQMSSRKIKQLVLRRLDINSVYDFDNSTLSVQKVQGHHVIKAEYEVRQDVIGNVDIVMSFNEVAKVPLR